MGKDPAVLFYTSDFLTGTLTMTDENIGRYIKLLCLQHQKGRLSEQDMMYICKSYVEDIFSKFTKDDNGFYYNKRMEDESLKRQKYSNSRRNNILNRYKKDKNISTHESTYVEHMENVNENENENINEIKQLTDLIEIFEKKELLEFFKKKFSCGMLLTKMESLIKETSFDRVKDYIKYMVEYSKINKIENPPGFLVKGVKEKWKIL